jgi:transcriptional regulator with GAF, ATPase, and Fis domain
MIGRFEIGDGSIPVVDEIGELPLEDRFMLLTLRFLSLEKILSENPILHSLRLREVSRFGKRFAH